MATKVEHGEAGEPVTRERIERAAEIVVWLVEQGHDYALPIL